jgi:hypothetical protein
MAAHHRDKKLTTTEKLTFIGQFHTNIILTHMTNRNKLHKKLLFLKYEFFDIK